jgi:uncharacterized membrane protein
MAPLIAGFAIAMTIAVTQCLVIVNNCQTNKKWATYLFFGMIALFYYLFVIIDL